MEVYWLEQAETEVPAGDTWLTASEADRQSAFAIPKRRADWRLGRWTAKRAVALLLRQFAPGDIEIRAASSGAPEVFADDRRQSLTISITHSNGRACCAATRGAAALGCDLEMLEPRTPAFIADYFTAREQELIASHPMLATLFWSAKESALKAIRAGLREDARSVEVGDLDIARPLKAEGWRALRVRRGPIQFDGWWSSDGCFVRTVVSTPSSSQPRVFEGTGLCNTEEYGSLNWRT